MNLTDQEIKQLEDAPDGDAWDKVVEKIKAKRQGKYPADWYKKVILGNLKTKVDLTLSISAIRAKAFNATRNRAQ